MEPISHQSWNDLSGYAAHTYPIRPDVKRCAITQATDERLSLLLLPDGMVSIESHAFWPELGIQPTLPDLLACGRVVAAHTRAAEPRNPAMTAELNQLAQSGLAVVRLAWVHLPEISGVVARGPGRMAVTALRGHGSTVGLFTSLDTIRPISWLHLPEDPMEPQLLMAAAQAMIDGVPLIAGSHHRVSPSNR